MSWDVYGDYLLRKEQMATYTDRITALHGHVRNGLRALAQDDWYDFMTGRVVMTCMRLSINGLIIELGCTFPWCHATSPLVTLKLPLSIYLNYMVSPT